MRPPWECSRPFRDWPSADLTEPCAAILLEWRRVERMREPPHRSAGVFRSVLQILPLLALSSCVLIVGTSPTVISGATIVFVAIDDEGGAVASLRITVADVSGEWRDDGLTALDGSYRCGVRAGVTRVRAAVTLPSGFVLASSDPWPHEIDVSRGGTMRVEIRVKAPRH